MKFSQVTSNDSLPANYNNVIIYDGHGYYEIRSNVEDADI